MKVKLRIMLSLLLFSMMVFSQEGNTPGKAKSVSANPGKASLETEIKKLEAIDKLLVEAETGIKSSQESIVTIEKEITEHKEKIAQSAAKMAELKAAREELDAKIKAIEAEINQPNAKSKKGE